MKNIFPFSLISYGKNAKKRREEEDRMRKRAQLQEIYLHFMRTFDMGETPREVRPKFDEIYDEVKDVVAKDNLETPLSRALGLSDPRKQLPALEEVKEALRVIFLEKEAIEVKKKSRERSTLRQCYINSTWPMSTFWRTKLWLAELDLADACTFVRNSLKDAMRSGHREDEFQIVTEVLDEAGRADQDYNRAVGAK
jgi:hypothetical protein